MRSPRLAIGAFAFILSAACVVSTAQEPKKDPPAQEKKGFQKGGFGRTGGGGLPGTILSTGIMDQLKMTDEQKKSMEELQKDVDVKLEKILTEDQRKQLKELRDARANRTPGTFPGRTRPDAKKDEPKKDAPKKDD